jgi:hypothetical protein
MAASSWPNNRFLGSLRRFVEAQVAEHLNTNQTAKQHRDPCLARILGLLFRRSVLLLVLAANLCCILGPAQVISDT